MTKAPIEGADLHIELQMNNNGNIYKLFSSEGYDIDKFTNENAEYLNSLYPPADIDNYNAADMQKVIFSSYSATPWILTPPTF